MFQPSPRISVSSAPKKYIGEERSLRPYIAHSVFFPIPLVKVQNVVPGWAAASQQRLYTCTHFESCQKPMYYGCKDVLWSRASGKLYMNRAAGNGTWHITRISCAPLFSSASLHLYSSLVPSFLLLKLLILLFEETLSSFLQVCWWQILFVFPHVRRSWFSLHSWRISSLDIEFWTDSFFSPLHLKNVTLSSGLRGFLWEISCHSNCFFPKCNMLSLWKTLILHKYLLQINWDVCIL